MTALYAVLAAAIIGGAAALPRLIKYLVLKHKTKDDKNAMIVETHDMLDKNKLGNHNLEDKK